MKNMKKSILESYRLSKLDSDATLTEKLMSIANAGKGTGFAVATESADLAVSSFMRASTVGQAQENLRMAVEEAARIIEDVCRVLEGEFGFAFGGIDFSLAPYPETVRSVGYAVEQLGVDAFGGSATLFAAGLMTGVLRQAEFPRCGFCGLFFPVLEDRERGYDQ